MSTPPPPGPFPEPPPDQPAGAWASDVRAAGPGVPPAVEQPQTIGTAVRLMYVGAALSVLSILLALFQIDDIRDQIRDDDATLSSNELDAAVAVAVAFIVIVGLIGVGVWIWMAMMNGQGKRWARVVATVLGVLNVLSALAGLAGSDVNRTSTLGQVLGLLGAVLAAVILVLLWRPESTRYYDAMSPRR